MYHDLLDQSAPPTSLSHSLDFQAAGSNCDHIQGGHITQVEEQEGEDSFNISFLFQNTSCEDGVSSFLDDIESINLSSEYNEINLFISTVLGNNHSDDDDFFDVCNDEFLSVPSNFSFSHEYFNLDLEL